jgi:hypothetical protein
MTDHSRGDRQSDMATEELTEEILDLAESLPGGYVPGSYRKRGNRKKIAAELGVHPITVWRHLRPFVEEKREMNSEAFNEYRNNQFSRITEKWEEIENDASMSGAEKHAAWARWMKLEMDLLGTAAPSKSITAHVGSESSPLFLKFKKATAGLSEEQLEETFAQLASVPREAVATVRDASWFPAPEPKQLESGE